MPASEKLTIDTPEQIALEFPLASAGSRFLALAIDSLIQAAGILALLMVAIGARVLTSSLGAIGVWTLAALLVLAFLLYYGYYAAFEALWNGQTPGKRAIGLRVISTSGRPITVYDALLRNLLRIVDQLPFVYAIGLVSVFLTERNQRLGDLAADTVVVHEQPISHDIAAAPHRAPTRGAARLRADEVVVIERFLSRRQELPDALRDQTASALAARVRSRLEIAADSPIRDEALLEEVAAEFRSGR